MTAVLFFFLAVHRSLLGATSCSYAFPHLAPLPTIALVAFSLAASVGMVVTLIFDSVCPLCTPLIFVRCDCGVSGSAPLQFGSSHTRFFLGSRRFSSGDLCGALVIPPRWFFSLFSPKRPFFFGSSPPLVPRMRALRIDVSFSTSFSFFGRSLLPDLLAKFPRLV